MLLLQTPGGFRDCEWRLYGQDLEFKQWESAFAEALLRGPENTSATARELGVVRGSVVVGSGRRPTRSADEVIAVKQRISQRYSRKSFVSAGMEDLIVHLAGAKVPKVEFRVK